MGFGIYVLCEIVSKHMVGHRGRVLTKEGNKKKWTEMQNQYAVCENGRDRKDPKGHLVQHLAQMLNVLFLNHPKKMLVFS